MIVQRDLIKRIEPFIGRKEFISITGPRQSGKTTLLDMIAGYLEKDLKVDRKHIKKITFEDRRLLMEFERDPVGFVKSFRPAESKQRFYFMIDEFQYAENGGQRLKLVYDTLEKVKVIITGSSSLDIKAQTGKFMVGRMVNFTLYPFNFREYLDARKKRLENIYIGQNQIILGFIEGKRTAVKDGKDLFYEEFIPEYEKYSIWGGYPAAVLASTETERRKLLADIYNGYVLKDIKMVLELTTERNLFLLSQYLAAQTGGIVVYQNLSQVSRLDYRNLKKHLNVLEETFVCREVKPFFKNRQKELSKNPRIYFLDAGFRNNLVENMNGLEKRSDAGAIIENSCFVRLNELFEGINKINFWRTKAGAEVDFILHFGDGIIPIEVKYSLFDAPKAPKSFVSFIDSFHPARGIVLTKDYWGFARKNGTSILFAPAYYL